MINMQSYSSLALRVPKRALIFTTLWAVSFVLLVPAVRGFADEPVVAIDATERDFGDVYKGELLEQVFMVRNDGTAPLTLAEKSLTGQTDLSRETRIAVARPRAFNEALIPVALFARRAAPS
jgi:hypothetical protein